MEWMVDYLDTYTDKLELLNIDPQCIQTQVISKIFGVGVVFLWELIHEVLMFTGIGIQR